MSEYSWVSPAMADFRFSLVSPIGSPVAGSPTCLEVLEVPMGVAGLAFGGRAKHRRHIVVAFDIRLGREIQIAAIGLRFAGKCVLQILFGLGPREFHDSYLRGGDECKTVN